MPQDLTDRGQAGAAAQQLGRQRMTQPVRPDPAQPGSPAGSLDDVVDQFGADRAVRRPEVRNTCRQPAAARGDAGSRPAASPTSAGNGSRSSRRPLPRTTISPARQSTSPSSSRATSIDRKPNRATKVNIAKSRTPTSVEQVAVVEQRLDVRSGHRRRHRRQPPPTDRRHRGPQPDA